MGGTKYPQYYPELKSNFDFWEGKYFACDSMAVNYYCTTCGDDLMAVIKDDGNGNITCVQEFK